MVGSVVTVDWSFQRGVLSSSQREQLTHGNIAVIKLSLQLQHQQQNWRRILLMPKRSWS